MFGRLLKRPRDSTIALLARTLLIVALGCPLAVFAATNEATSPAGGGSSLNPSGQVTVNSVQLALVKQSRDLAGTVLPNGSNVTSGQVIYFVLYVDNTTVATATNIQITDLLNETQFTYVPNSLEAAVVPTGSNDAAIWAGAWTPLTDLLGGPDDIASITDSGGPAGLDKLAIGAVTGQANTQLDIPGNTLRAIRFRVTVN